MSDTSEFGHSCVGARVGACGRKHSATEALDVSAFMQRYYGRTVNDRTTFATGRGGSGVREIGQVDLKLKDRSGLCS